MAFVNQPKKQTYDLVLVGSSFASGFFLYEYLKTAPQNAKVLVLEKGSHNTHQWQLKHQKNSERNNHETYITQGLDYKTWGFTLGFGGSSNCWTGCCPRQLENDFRLKTKYGVGRDWPISYSDLEPYYAEVENFMGMAGPNNWDLAPRSTKYPLPAHRLTLPEETLVNHYKGLYYPQSTARPSRSFKNRPKCCSSGLCRLCPIDSVFTIQNSMMEVYGDNRVDIVTNATVDHLNTENNQVKSATYIKDGQEHEVHGNLFALGANGIFNPYILQKSGFKDEFLGRRIHEQVSTWVGFDLAGIKNYQGSTTITGQGFMWYDGDHRKEYGACLTEYDNNIRQLRPEHGRWTERMYIQFIVEDLPLDDNRVIYDPSVDKPIVSFQKHSEYGMKGLEKIFDYADEIAGILPVEKLYFDDNFKKHRIPRSTEAHIQGSVVMGKDPKTSVVDENLVQTKVGSVGTPIGRTKVDGMTVRRGLATRVHAGTFVLHKGNFLQFAVDHHFAFPHDTDGIAQVLQFSQHVGGYQDGFAVPGQFLEQVTQLDAGLGIEVGGGFVELKDRWVMNQCLGQQSPLLHAA